MAEFNRSEAYDLSLFGMPETKPLAAPEWEQPQPAKRPAVKRQKSAAQLRKESIASALRALKLFVVSATLMLLLGAILYSKINLVILQRDAGQLETQISEAQAENTRLVMQLNSTVSIEKVDAYAVSVLGMHKLERYQIHYFGNRDGDRVVVADGKAVAQQDAESGS